MQEKIITFLALSNCRYYEYASQLGVTNVVTPYFPQMNKMDSLPHKVSLDGRLALTTFRKALNLW